MLINLILARLTVSQVPFLRWLNRGKSNKHVWLAHHQWWIHQHLAPIMKHEKNGQRRNVIWWVSIVLPVHCTTILFQIIDRSDKNPFSPCIKRLDEVVVRAFYTACLYDACQYVWSIMSNVMIDEILSFSWAWVDLRLESVFSKTALASCFWRLLR